MRREARLGPRHPWLGAAGYYLSLPLHRALFSHSRVHSPDSSFAASRVSAIRQKWRRGETVYLCGIGPAGHNSGVALLEIPPDREIRIICNNEEERFSGHKHCADYPEHAVGAMFRLMERRRIDPSRIDAWLATWDYASLSSTLVRAVLEEFPATVSMLRPSAFPKLNAAHLFAASQAPLKLARQIGSKGHVPIIGMPHHDNHAWFSYGVSPFAKCEEPVMISVLDGTGDLGAISLYLAENGSIRRTFSNGSVFDSLGLYYSFLSSTQGGWTMLSSEGRYMGAAAWGNSDRLTNPYYSALRQVFDLLPDGRIRLNRSLANWPSRLFDDPYSAALREILGDPIAGEQMWNPDVVLRVEAACEDHDSERLDKAAAVQMVFEDAAFHIIGAFIRRTGSNRLVLTGGTALNATANYGLLERFDEEFYERYTHRKGVSLHLWVPPTPGDCGVTLGAAYAFAVRAGSKFGPRLDHAFYCGEVASAAGILNACRAVSEISWMSLGDASASAWRDALADLMAFITSRNGVIAIFQGSAETGPRALGHRSILANPCNPRTLEILNRHVKYREVIRPLAPMATYEAAQRWFDLPEGASDDDYNAYNYMVLTARARPEAFAKIPAVIHRDGTSRVQIVRPHVDPFIHAYLKALGRRIGVELAVNTSFNVAGPIVQTEIQALETLKRSKGLDAVFFLADCGAAFAAWHNVVNPPKDGGQRFQKMVSAWKQELQISAIPLQA